MRWTDLLLEWGESWIIIIAIVMKSWESGDRSKSRVKNGKTKRKRRVSAFDCIESIKRTENVKSLERGEEEKSKVKRDVGCFCSKDKEGGRRIRIESS